MISLLLAWNAWACDTPSTVDDIDAALDDAEKALRDLDNEAFLSGVGRAEAALPCLSQSLSRRTAARIHRFYGIRAFGDEDRELSARSFAAARSLEPRYVFPTTLIAEGTPVLEDYKAFDLTRGTSEDVALPTEGYLKFDGQVTVKRPTNWPTIVQYFDTTGGVGFTQYALPQEQLRPYPGAASPPVEGEEPGTKTPRKGPNKALLAATATTAVATGVMYTVAGIAHGTYQDPQTNYEDLPSLKQRANTMSVASGVSGAATIGLGVAVALTW